MGLPIAIYASAYPFRMAPTRANLLERHEVTHGVWKIALMSRLAIKDALNILMNREHERLRVGRLLNLYNPREHVQCRCRGSSSPQISKPR